MTLRVSPRLAGIAFVVVGLWFAVLVPPHPNILNDDVATAVLHSSTWRAAHTGMFVAGLAAIVAAAGMVALHGRRLGRAGDTALVAMLVSGGATASAGLLEATIFPFLARTQPDSIAFDGPIFTAPLFRALTGPWLLFPVVFAFLGWLARRVGDYGAAGSALAVTGVGFFVFGMWFVPVVGVVSSVAFGVVLCWWGTIVWNAEAR